MADMATKQWTEKQTKEVMKKVIRRAEVSRIARLLQHRLALATVKTQHGWQNLTLDAIEPKVDANLKRKRLHPSSLPPHTSPQNDLHDHHHHHHDHDHDATGPLPTFPPATATSVKRRNRASTTSTTTFTSTTPTTATPRRLIQSSPLPPPPPPPPRFHSSPPAPPPPNTAPRTPPPPHRRRRRTKFQPAFHSSPPKTPPRRMKEGADLLLYLATSPSPAAAAVPPPPLTPQPPAGFNFADFVNITPSPAQAAFAAGGGPQRTPIPKTAQRRLNFDQLVPPSGLAYVGVGSGGGGVVS